VLREEAARAGRSLERFEVTIYGMPPDAERLRTFRDAGITRVLFFVPSVAQDEALRVLDGYAKLAREIG
jgi:hypothetical protein